MDMDDGPGCPGPDALGASVRHNLLYDQSITTVSPPIVISSRNPPHGYRKKENMLSLLPEPLGAC